MSCDACQDVGTLGRDPSTGDVLFCEECSKGIDWAMAYQQGWIDLLESVLRMEQLEMDRLREQFRDRTHRETVTV